MCKTSHDIRELQSPMALENTALKRNSPSLWLESHSARVCDGSSINDDTVTPSDDVPRTVETLLEGKATSLRLKEAWLTVKNRIMSRQIGKCNGCNDEKRRGMQCNSARREFVVEVANSVVRTRKSLDRDDFRTIGELHQGLTQKQCLATRDMSAAVDPAWFK